MPQQVAETEVIQWLNADFLKGGLHVNTPPSPYEEKSEARSTGSTPTDPTTPQAPQLDVSPIDVRISVGFRFYTSGYLSTYLSIVLLWNRICKSHCIQDKYVFYLLCWLF